MNAVLSAEKIYDFKKSWDQDIAENNGIQGVVDYPIMFSYTLTRWSNSVILAWTRFFPSFTKSSWVSAFSALVFLDGSKAEIPGSNFWRSQFDNGRCR